MKLEYTLTLKKIVHDFVEAENIEEAKKLIAQKYYPLSSQGYFILEDEIEFENTDSI